MQTMKAYTDVPQSKRLAEILPLESADMYYPWYIEEDGDTIESGHRITTPDVGSFTTHKVNKMTLPCWSLSALLDLMPKIHGERPRLDTGRIQTEKYYVEYPYHESTKNDWYSTKLCDSAVDACYEMILKLNELNLL